MCGITGIAATTPILDRGPLTAAREAMKHRGPDDAGEWWATCGRVGLAHRRLSIIDLSPAGHQPMHDASGSLTIVFNGEIYNFRELRARLVALGATFRSNSDTEVILAAYQQWDTECLQHLQGMFAFALYDGKRQRLFLARDRAGEKPLFYALSGTAIRFASELKGLMADRALPRRVDPQALDYFLAEGYVPGARCILAGVAKLPPAHALTFELASGQTRVWRYWQLPEEQNTHSDEGALLEELEALLEAAVGRQLVADVPVGVLLSGGVDSSLVTAMASRATSRVKTFTVRFPGHGKFDETAHARLIARHFGTEHYELEAEPASSSILPALARQFDEPIIDSSMVPTYFVSRLVRQHCTVALGGDGGDELFGGYSHYDRLLWMERNFGWLPRAARVPIAAAAGALLPTGFKGRNWLQGLGVDLDASVPLIASYFDSRERRRLLGAHMHVPLAAEHLRAERIPRRGDLLQRSTRLDFESYLPEDILVKVDRASMMSSLELRAPMLDVPLVEFAFGKVPSRLKTTAGERKVLLKKLAARVLPQEFDRKRKQGFSLPLASWLEDGSWADFFRDVLLSSQQTTFDRGVMEQLLHGQRQGRANAERLFGLVMFELWRREYRVEVGGR